MADTGSSDSFASIFAATRRKPSRGRAAAPPAGGQMSLLGALEEPTARPETPQTLAPKAAAPAAPDQPPTIAAPQPAPALDRNHVWTVAELLRQVRGDVEARFRRLTIEGEILNWRRAGSGHCYFTLRDGAAQIAVVMFRREAANLHFVPADGASVRVTGDVTVYEARGQMQVVATGMTLAGVGALLAAVQELKERLRREGLFERKRPLPPFPHCIGVVTSADGAALRDIVKVCRRRHAAVNLLVYPATVQGPRCAEEVAAGVRWFSEHAGRADVVIVARGGGSWEDLHGFDDERVVRAIAACALPVISAVGHATDSVLADNAADVCTPTPSAAAELVTAAQHRAGERLAALSARAVRAVRFRMLTERHRLGELGADVVLLRTPDRLRRHAQRVDELEARAAAALQAVPAQLRARLRLLDERLARRDLRVQLRVATAALHGHDTALRAAAARLLAERRARTGHLQARLEAMSPLRVLDRGYALVFDAAGQLLRDAARTSEGDTMTARLAKGSLRARVLAVEPGS